MAPKSTLMAAVLRGLAKFAHTINIDFFADLVEVLNGLIRSEQLETSQCLHAVQVVLIMLSGQVRSVFTEFYRVLPSFFLLPLFVGRSVEHRSVVLLRAPVPRAAATARRLAEPRRRGRGARLPRRHAHQAAQEGAGLLLSPSHPSFLMKKRRLTGVGAPRVGLRQTDGHLRPGRAPQRRSGPSGPPPPALHGRSTFVSIVVVVVVIAVFVGRRTSRRTCCWTWSRRRPAAPSAPNSTSRSTATRPARRCGSCTPWPATTTRPWPPSPATSSPSVPTRATTSSASSSSASKSLGWARDPLPHRITPRFRTSSTHPRTRALQKIRWGRDPQFGKPRVES